jgi:(1->4)-alpha-D-glucan 1-alpha-D-glucosylmutase
VTARVPRWYPSSTYRLQLQPAFGFRQAAEVVAYLERLGIGGLYLSPMMRARPGSTHGYDICDHTSLNPELGSTDDLAALAARASASGMGIVADIVPNHVGVDPSVNLWWREVLENGPCSSYAGYFDIDWDPVTPHLRQKVLLPILGDQYGAVLERGELQLAFEDGHLELHYHEHRLPINPRQSPIVLKGAVPILEQVTGPDAPELIEFLSILTGLSNLPPYTDTRPESIAVREREKQVLRQRLTRLVEEAPHVAEAIHRAVREANGIPGRPDTFDTLHELLEAQPYRLASWRTAMDEINYRRFFDVNELAGVRVEDPAVFEATHALVASWIANGWVQGLRVDHPDGLFNPAQYFARLQRLAARALERHAETNGNGAAAVRVGDDDEPPPERPFWVVAEKILSHREELRPDWQVAGTTGYTALNDINGLFVDPAGLKTLRRIYARATGERDSLDEIVYDSKKLIINTAMSSELGVLVDALGRIAVAHRHTRDFTQNSLRDLITEYVASFPVYRTYVHPGGWTPTDEAIVEQTLARARRRNPAMEASLFTFLRAVLLPGPVTDEPTMGPDHLPSSEADRQQRIAFSMKLQQYTGPVQAKALEDTSFYRYNVLVSINEVGSEPSHAPRTVAQLHAANAARQRSWPFEMTTLSTHDTKLGEDVRARINVLSEIPSAWREAFGRATRAASSVRTMVDGAWAPDRSDEYRFYQVLLGVWPGPDVVEAPMPDEFVERLQAYMLKAIREAKRHTSWLTPNEAYEQATLTYVREVLTGRPSRRVIAMLAPLAARVMRHGVVNSLAQTTMKLGAPGVPDTYQGTESWSFVLVDPDNRRLVDFDGLERTLAETDALREGGRVISDEEGEALLDAWPDGRVKMLVASRMLRERRANPELWVQGAYMPLDVSVDVDASAVAWMREHGDKRAIVVSALRTARLGPHRWPTGGAWGPSRLLLPPDLQAARVRDLFTGATHPVVETDSERWLFFSLIFGALPVSVLIPEG